MNLKINLNTKILQKNIAKILLFIVTLSAKITDQYEIPEDPIYQLKTSATKVYIAKDKSTNQKFIIKFRTVESDFIFHTRKIEKLVTTKFQHEVIPETTENSYVLNTENPKKRKICVIYKYNEESTLKDHVITKNRSNNFMAAEAIEILRNILLGIEFFNNKNLYLVNLSTENTLVNEHCEVKFIDFSFFGLDKNNLATNIHQINLSRFIGIIAPEITNNKILSTKSDMYSFGLIMQSINSLINFTNTEDLKNQYENLMNACLNEDVNKRTDIRSALCHPLFQSFLPDLYEFAKLEDFAVQANDLLIKKAKNALTFIKKRESVRIIQNKELPIEETTLHILKPEDFTFFINGTEYHFYSISSKNMEYILTIFKCVKIKASQNNLVVEVPKKSSLEDWTHQLEQQQKEEAAAQTSYIPTQSQLIPTETNIKSPQLGNTSNRGITLQEGILIGIVIFVVCGIISFLIYKIFNEKNDNELKDS